MTGSAKPESKSSTTAGFAVGLFSLPGATFSFAFLADRVFDLRQLPTSLAAVLSFAALIGGAISILATPAAIFFAYLGREGLRGSSGTVAKVLLALAAMGWVLFVLQYFNPFVHG